MAQKRQGKIMYVKDGITYVEGIEELWMGYFLKYHKDRYKHVERKEKATPEQIAKVKEAERLWKLKRQAQYRQPPKPIEVKESRPQVIESPDAAEMHREKMRETSRNWYHAHREQQLARRKKWYQEHKEEQNAKRREEYYKEQRELGKDPKPRVKLNIPYPPHSTEYHREYYKLHKEKIEARRRKSERD